MAYLDKAGLAYFWGKVKAQLDGKVDTDTLADYVVAQGTSGNWRYIKWANGFAICWGYTITLDNFDSSDPWGNLYCGGEAASVAYPFTFAEIPFCWVSRTSADTTDYNSKYSWFIQTGGSMSATPLFQMVRATALTIGHPVITLVAIGRWK